MRETTCRQARKLMSARLDGLSAAEDELRLQAHIQDCPDCGEHWAYLTRLERDLGAVEMIEPPTTFVEGVLGRMRHARQSTPDSEPNVRLVLLVTVASAVCLSCLSVACGVLGVLGLPQLYSLLGEIGRWLGGLMAIVGAMRAAAAAVWDVADSVAKTPLPTVASTSAGLSACLLILWLYVVSNWRGVPVLPQKRQALSGEGTAEDLGNGGN